MNIQIYIKHVYGKETVYPACDKAKAFAALIGQKTFTHSDLCKIEAIGVTIQNVPMPLSDTSLSFGRARAN